jgi:Asparaginase
VGVGATGIGEAITRGMISLRVADRILDGNDLEESMMWALDECLEEGAEVGIIALGAEGTGHGVSNSTNMPWSSWIARK